MNRHLRKVTFGLIGLLIISSSIYGAETGIVTARNLNVRSGPSTSHQIIAQKTLGQQVTILERTNNWFKIKLDNDQTAFVSGDYVNIQEQQRASREAVVTANVLNVRSMPSLSSPVLSKFSRNEKLNVMSQEGEWYLVSNGAIQGYVHGDFLEFSQAQTNLSQTSIETQATDEMVAVVNASVLNIRQQPSLDAAVVGKTYQNNQLTVSDIFDQWVEIINTDGSKGYVFRTYVTLRERALQGSTDDVRQQVVAYARQFLGNPYVFGGNSLTRGTDCSGFTQLVLRHFGYNISRTSRTQINDGTRINRSDLLPGDLVFYGYNNSISHVAMFIGNNQVIHANTPSTGIIISNVNIGIPYIGATRIIN